MQFSNQELSSSAMHKIMLQFTSNIRKGSKCDLSDFDHGIAVGAKWVTVLQVETQDTLMKKVRGEWPV